MDGATGAKLAAWDSEAEAPPRDGRREHLLAKTSKPEAVRNNFEPLRNTRSEQAKHSLLTARP